MRVLFVAALGAAVVLPSFFIAASAAEPVVNKKDCASIADYGKGSVSVYLAGE